MMKTYRKSVMAATAALGGFVLLAATAAAHGPGGPGQNAGGGTPFATAPGSMMGPGSTMGPGAGYRGMMGPGYRGTMGPGGPGMTAPGATHTPQSPCYGEGTRAGASCGPGNHGAYPSPNQQALPPWR